MKALANEIAKNLVLAGIGSLTFVDDELVTEDDLGAQFFISEQHIGMNVRLSPQHPFQVSRPLTTPIASTSRPPPDPKTQPPRPAPRHHRAHPLSASGILRSLYSHNRYRPPTFHSLTHQRLLPHLLAALLRRPELWPLRLHLRRPNYARLHHNAEQIQHPDQAWSRVRHPLHRCHHNPQRRWKNYGIRHQARTLHPSPLSQHLTATSLPLIKLKTQARRPTSPLLPARPLGIPSPHHESLPHALAQRPRALHQISNREAQGATTPHRDTARRFPAVFLAECRLGVVACLCIPGRYVGSGCHQCGWGKRAANSELGAF